MCEAVTNQNHSAGKYSSREFLGRRIRFVILVVLWAGVQLASRADQSVSLAWDSSPDTNIVGYAVYFRNSSGAYDSRLDVGTNISTTVTGLAGGLTYFFIATAYDAAGLESEPSNEVTFDVP